MRRAFVLSAMFAGCFFAPDRPAQQTGDAGGDGSVSATCPNPGPWVTPQQVTSPTTGIFDLDAALSPDGTHLVFARTDVMTYSHLYMMRVMSGPMFGSAVELTTLTGTAGDPTWSPDGTKLYFFQDGARVTSAFDGSGFAPPSPTYELTSLSPALTSGRVSFSGDGSAMYYEVNGSDGETHTWRATGKVGMGWITDRELTELDTGSDQETPWISPDELEIFFATTVGNAELRTARRSSRTEPFGAPTALVYTQRSGWRPTLSHDGTLLLYSDVGGRLFYTTRTCH